MQQTEGYSLPYKYLSITNILTIKIIFKLGDFFSATITHNLYVLKEIPASIFQIYTEEVVSLSVQDFPRNWPVYTFRSGGWIKY
jgi:hypothetical protein